MAAIGTSYTRKERIVEMVNATATTAGGDLKKP
jgi:hypothetical protein